MLVTPIFSALFAFIGVIYMLCGHDQLGVSWLIAGMLANIVYELERARKHRERP